MNDKTDQTQSDVEYLLAADKQQIERRMDLSILQAYRDAGSSIRTVRSNVIENWKSDEKLGPLSLSMIEGFSLIDADEDQRATRSLADYWFEYFMMPSMNLGQVRDYHLAIRQTYDLHVELSQAELTGPLVIETCHHACVFSLCYALLSQELKSKYDFDRVVLVHLRDPIDPRLAGLQALSQMLAGIECICIQMTDGWLNELSQAMDGNSILVYFGDMPKKLFSAKQRGKRAAAQLRIYATNDAEIELESVSIASTLARRFKALHYTLDFPAINRARFREARKNQPITCLAADWIFWPAIADWYNVSPTDSSSASSE